jgi:hypothetical protein
VPAGSPLDRQDQRMSTTLPASPASFRASTPTCPHCDSHLAPQGESPLRYWSCASCNLVFLA